MDELSAFLFAAIGENTIEWVAVVLGLVNVVLIIRRSVWNYPFGLAMVALYAKIFADYRLYSDAGLQLFYFVIQIYGWWNWAQGRGGDGRVIVVRVPMREWPLYLGGAVAGPLLIGGAMDRFTDAASPLWDATIATLSVIAQIQLSRRQLESWAFWIVVDVLAIGLFVARGLMPTAGLYVVFLVLACVGGATWLRAWRRGSPA